MKSVQKADLMNKADTDLDDNVDDTKLKKDDEENWLIQRD